MRIVNGVNWVEGVDCNVYVVEHDGKLVIVDSGSPRNEQKILACVTSLGYRPKDVTTIVLTHFHIDHAGSAKRLKELTGAKIAIHELDAPYISGKEEAPKSKSMMFRFEHSIVKSGSVEPDVILKHNREVDGLIVVHMPGHSDGNIALYDPQHKVMFTGDSIRFMNGKILGPPEHYTQDAERAKESLGRLTGYTFEIMLGGHGEPLRPEADKKVKAYYQSLFS